VFDMAIGLFVLRVALGALLVGHGTQKLFGWFGGGGLVGTSGMFRKMGYRIPSVAAVAAGLTETGAGTLLLLGFLTPLAAAAAIGAMVNAVGVAAGRGLWATKGGFELPMFYAIAAAALALTGPGAASVDAALRWDHPAWYLGLAAVALGIVAGVAVLGTRTPPTAAERPAEPGRRAA
jgi:putative oxidoreductase